MELNGLGELEQKTYNKELGMERTVGVFNPAFNRRISCWDLFHPSDLFSFLENHFLAHGNTGLSIKNQSVSLLLLLSIAFLICPIT